MKLFVSNFPYTTTERELLDLFAEAGTVQSARVVLDQETGRARGFGFVTMASEVDARAAIQRFDGSNLGGRNITVAPAKAQTTRSKGRQDGHRDRAPREARW